MSISRIYTNTDAQMAIAFLEKNQFSMTATLRRLSSGLRVITGADDPSGIGIITSFKRQISGTEQAIVNTQEGLTMLQTADAALNETIDVLFRMKDLAIKAANSATITTAAISQINSELQSLKSEITRRSSAITFNTKSLFDGGFAVGQPLQIGPDNNSANTMTIVISAVTLTNLYLIDAGTWGTMGSLAISNYTGAIPYSTAVSFAQVAMDVINSAINIVSNVRSTIGVQESRLNFAINDLTNMDVNLTAALSNVQDADMASEIAEFARLQVISQTGIAMLAQANLQPQQILTLLGSATGQ